MMAIKRRLREVREIGEDRMACLYNRKNNRLVYTTETRSKGITRLAEETHERLYNLREYLSLLHH